MKWSIISNILLCIEIAYIIFATYYILSDGLNIYILLGLIIISIAIWINRINHKTAKLKENLGLKVCYTEIGGAGGEAMKKDEKTTEVLERRGKGNYEQNLEHVSRRGETDAGAYRSEYIWESKRDETIQDAVTVQVDNTGEIGK